MLELTLLHKGTNGKPTGVGQIVLILFRIRFLFFISRYENSKEHNY